MLLTGSHIELFQIVICVSIFEMWATHRIKESLSLGFSSNILANRGPLPWLLSPRNNQFSFKFQLPGLPSHTVTGTCSSEKEMGNSSLYRSLLMVCLLLFFRISRWFFFVFCLEFLGVISGRNGLYGLMFTVVLKLSP